MAVAVSSHAAVSYGGVLVLATIAQRIRFEAVAGFRVVPEAGVTLYPKHGIRMRLHARR
jgi:hypothetical protein